MSIKKIVILGPESTGKSTLCEMLAAHYKTAWVREYARGYLLKYGTAYNFEDLLQIAKGQLALEDSTEKAIADKKLPLFIDTDMYVMKVWEEFVFNKSHNWILDQIAERHYDLYLLCNPDLPWIKDELREYPDLENRVKLYHIYRHNMLTQHVPYIEITGNYEQRFQKAVASIDKLLAG